MTGATGSPLSRVREPFATKTVELHDRIVRTPHTTARAGAWPGADPGIGDALIRFHDQRASADLAGFVGLPAFTEILQHLVSLSDPERSVVGSTNEVVVSGPGATA